MPNTLLMAFDSCGGNLLACNDDDGAACEFGDEFSTIQWVVPSGETHYVRVTGEPGPSHSGGHRLMVAAETVVPANDTCTSALSVGDGYLHSQNCGATDDGDLFMCAGAAAGNDVWFQYTNTDCETRVLTAETCGARTNFDTILSVFDSCGGNQVICVDNSSQCDPDGGPFVGGSRATWPMPAGATHFIRVSGADGESGDFDLTISSAIAFDSDGDGVGDSCDNCPGFDDALDADGDGVPDGCDNCLDNANAGQEDVDAADAVSVWRFDEGAGSTASDTFGSNDGSINGATFVAGQVSPALSFDGVADDVVVPNDPSLELIEGTLMAWIRPAWVSGSLPTNPAIMGLREGAVTRYSLHLRADYSGIDFWNGSSVVPFATGALSQDTWAHVALTVSGGTVKCYIDGAQIDTDKSGAFGVATGIDFNIGSNGSDEHFQGLIDEVAVFGRALTDTEVMSIFTMGFSDGVGDACDVCPDAYDPNQVDIDGDGVGDACDDCPNRRPGDVSGDGNVNDIDTAPFIGVMLNPAGASPDNFCAADVNGDLAVDGLDVQPFVDLLVP